MSSKTMDNFDEMTNDQLRVRLLEHGFSNLPVTTTTRKVLIKKLRNSIQGQKDKTRRETVHVVKYSSGEEESDSDSKKKKSSLTAKLAVKDNNRRATISVTEMKQPEKVTSRRRSGRITPANTTESAPITTAPTVPIILEDTDEEETFSIPVKPVANNRRSKTPTLSKSEQISVSIKHVRPTLDDVVEEQPVIQEEFIRPQTRTPVPKSSILSQPDNNGYSSTSSFSSARKRLTISGAIGDAYNAEPTFASKPTSYTSRQSFASPSYVSSYQTSSTRFGGTPLQKQFEDADDDDYETDDYPTKKIETRHLSDFSQRLAQLRADPLPLGYEKDVYASGVSSPYSPSSGYRSNITARRSVNRQAISKWAELNNKYNINRNLLILFSILVIIFIIIWFFF